MERSWKEDQERIRKEIAGLEAAVAALEQNREPVVAQLDPASIGMYEELRKTKQGRAVAKVKQSTCQGCRISLPVSDQQRARIGQELAKCSNCGRILYAE
jgi:predicted  nucleic acid-binding Zn-ribbon protein